jgi:hypothetical protein
MSPAKPSARRAVIDAGPPANDEMVSGYLDGYDLDAPEPTENRTHSHRHGFANGRDDRAGKPRASAAELRQMAALAMMKDRQ